MSRMMLPRRSFAAALAGTAAAGSFGRRARAAGPTKIRLITSWFAQAEHGGHYQAKATGLYERAGLDVEIKMGGPQVNPTQLMLGGEADIIMGYPLQVLKAQEQNLPVVAIGTSFQFDLVGLMTHDDVPNIAALKNHRILIANSTRTTWWPWLKNRFGFTDGSAAPYTFNLQPFLVDRNTAVQSYVTSEPFEAAQQGAKVKFFLLADDGYPPYGNTLMTTRPFLQNNAEALRRFLQVTAEGWKSYVTGDPAPGNALIQADNPRMTSDRIAYAIGKLREIKALEGHGPDAAAICTMNEASWEKTRDFMVGADLLKASAPWRNAFTLDLVRDMRVTLS
ncbi:ABC transporter substrate-binding protein [Roseomonas sp. BN140053]|uniref:ABC transporter substrate-binding protein n=1 Tax=Roseomonas sp. BN140053 TaxID=3391898 RepID=UPI0039EB8EAA